MDYEKESRPEGWDKGSREYKVLESSLLTKDTWG